jgi:hypothetical protein
VEEQQAMVFLQQNKKYFKNAANENLLLTV